MRQGWTIVDSGIDDPATRAAWESIFATVLGGLPVLRVIVTHMHPDHIGCAHWLCERWNVRLWISATDFNVARLASSASAGFGGPLSAAFMAQHGLAADPDAVHKVGARTNYYRSLVPALPASYRRLFGGGSVAIGSGARRSLWTCHAGFGHAPEHMALHDPTHGVLISGDMVLPRISTNVSVIDIEPEADSLTPLSRLDRADARYSRRRAGAALARPAVQGPAHPHRPAAGSTTTRASSTCWRRSPPRARRAPSSWCR